MRTHAAKKMSRFFSSLMVLLSSKRSTITILSSATISQWASHQEWSLTTIPCCTSPTVLLALFLACLWTVISTLLKFWPLGFVTEKSIAQLVLKYFPDRACSSAPQSAYMRSASRLTTPCLISDVSQTLSTM